MPAGSRHQYTEDFKREAVLLVRESAHPVAQVAWDLGILSTYGLAGAPSTGQPRPRARYRPLNAPRPRNSHAWSGSGHG